MPENESNEQRNDEMSQALAEIGDKVAEFSDDGGAAEDEGGTDTKAADSAGEEKGSAAESGSDEDAGMFQDDRGKESDEDSEPDEFPWDIERQKRDQEFANLRKAHEKVLQEFRELKEALRQAVSNPNRSAGRTMEDAIAELESLQTPDAFAGESEIEAYQAKHKALVAEIRRLADQRKADSGMADVDSRAGEKKAEGDDEEDVSKSREEGITREQYAEILKECDDAYGPDLRRSANAEIQKILKARGYVDGNVPPKMMVEDIAHRVYIAQRLRVDRQAKKGSSGSSQAGQRRGQTGRADESPAVIDPREALPLRVVAEKLRAKLQAQKG